MNRVSSIVDLIVDRFRVKKCKKLNKKRRRCILLEIQARVTRVDLVNYFNELWLMPPPVLLDCKLVNLAAVLPICFARLGHK